MTRSRRTWFACTVAMAAAWCAAPPPPAPDLAAVASRYIRLAQDLARHDPSLIDHWLVPAPAGEGARRPAPLLRIEADALEKDADTAVPETSGADRWRAERLLGQVRGLQLAARRLAGESLPFDAEAGMAFGIEPRRADRFKADRAIESLERELPGSAPLRERLAAFRARFQVADDAAAAVVRAALGACRQATRAALALPEDESVEIALVDALPWDGQARYLGEHRTRVEVNASAPLDLSRALRLACHEGYPGHHVQYLWTVDELVHRRGWREFGLVPGFGPALLLAEGAAEVGADLAVPAAERALVYRRVLVPAAGLSRVTDDDLRRLVRIEDAQSALEPLIGDIARDYLDNRITSAAATERLAEEVLMPDAEAFVFFIERRRTRVLAYAEGRRLVGERLGSSALPALRDLFVPPRPDAKTSARVPPCSHCPGSPPSSPSASS